VEPVSTTRPRPGGQAPVCVVATRIVQEAVNANVSVEDLAKMAQSDAGFAARVLSMVNSAAYGRGSKIADIRQACSLFGVRGLRNIALGLVVGDMIPMGEDGNALLTPSLRRGVAARLIAEALGERTPDDAFTAGMLLEIGLLGRARTDLAGAALVARMPAAHRPMIERSFGFDDHPSAGSALAAQMKLPESIVDAIAHHHDPAPPESRSAKIAWAAERVAGAWEGGELTRVGTVARQALRAVGVGPDAIEPLLLKVPELVTLAAATFARKIGEQINLEQLAADAHARLVEMNSGYEQLLRRLEALLREKEKLAEDLKQANVELANLATTDALTGLPNKRAFTEALARDVARAARSGTPLSLIVVDVDHFKKVNDTWGHQTGDVALAKVGEVLRASTRAGDVLGRWGGEEFVVLLPGSDREGGRVVAERVRVALEKAVIVGPKGKLSVTASFGVAVLTGPMDAGSDLVARADEALYAAKHAGRNRVVVAPSTTTPPERPSRP
jgi:diguanylate cyclase (GGDEF)-like protein